MTIDSARIFLAPLLNPLSKVYAGVMRCREAAYARGLLPSATPHAPSIAVGNIAWGGSGKTPLASWLLAWAEEKGLTPTLISRGYGGRSKVRPLLVKSGILPQESGDEPLMLALQHPKAVILADPSRRRALKFLQKHASKPAASQLIIFDDAMQHLAARRDLNLVLLRPQDLLEEWGKTIPSGSWREGVSALKRASAFLLRADPETMAVLAPAAAKRLENFAVPVFSFYLHPQGLRRIRPFVYAVAGQTETENSLSAQTVQAAYFLNALAARSALGKGYVLCSAVGSPAGVEQSALAIMGRPPLRHYRFKDHYAYTQADFVKMCEPGLPLLCTDKDAVKLAVFTDTITAVPVYSLVTEVRFGAALFTDIDFATWLEKKWRVAVALFA